MNNIDVNIAIRKSCAISQSGDTDGGNDRRNNACDIWEPTDNIKPIS